MYQLIIVKDLPVTTSTYSTYLITPWQNNIDKPPVFYITTADPHFTSIGRYIKLKMISKIQINYCLVRTKEIFLFIQLYYRASMIVVIGYSYLVRMSGHSSRAAPWLSRTVQKYLPSPIHAKASLKRFKSEISARYPLVLFRFPNQKSNCTRIPFRENSGVLRRLPESNRARVGNE